MKKHLPLFIGLAFFFGCESWFNNEQEAIWAHIDGDSIIIKNGFTEERYYAVFDESWLATINWAPAVGEKNRIESKETVLLPLENIIKQEHGKIIVFYWDKNISEISECVVEY